MLGRTAKKILNYIYIYITIIILLYNQFHKTLPKSSLQMHWISVKFYEMGDSCIVEFVVYSELSLNLDKNVWLPFAFGSIMCL